eukprot:TRINITY_DN4452_c0_g1_i1.p1 TRINITY_DN4452_c0_g1~~TRINITY_DN4452_c0_g1_i1.p1  ORF type:complete len:215 (-),score=34.24 TRINITY_DN4452_c0_g1_i1:244-888(-)
MAEAKGEDFSTGFTTRAVHFGQEPDPQTQSIATPIYMTSNFRIKGEDQKYFYSRVQNPTRFALEQNLRSLEKAKYGLCPSSRMGTFNCVMHLFKPGEHILIDQHVSCDLINYMKEIAVPNQGIVYDVVDTTLIEKLVKAETKAVIVQSLSESLLLAADIPTLSKVCKEKKILLIVDNSLLSPYLLNPLELGADIVFNSISGIISESQSWLLELQ